MTTPNDLEILIHFHRSPHTHLRWNEPGVRETIEHYFKEGIIRPQYPVDRGTGVYHTGQPFDLTPKGKAWLDAILAVPMPTEPVEQPKPAEQPKEVWQYYHNASSSINSLCPPMPPIFQSDNDWHDEGCGYFFTHHHNAPLQVLKWRIKPTKPSPIPSPSTDHFTVKVGHNYRAYPGICASARMAWQQDENRRARELMDIMGMCRQPGEAFSWGNYNFDLNVAARCQLHREMNGATSPNDPQPLPQSEKLEWACRMIERLLAR